MNKEHKYSTENTSHLLLKSDRDKFNFLFYEPAELNFSKLETKIKFPSEDQNIFPCL